MKGKKIWSNLIFLCLLAALFGFCRKEESKDQTKDDLSPEVFFAASIEFSDLNLEFKEKWLAILEEHGRITPEAHEELRKVSEEMNRRHKEVFVRYKLSGPDWAKNSPSKKGRDSYLKEHPEIKKKLDGNRKKMLDLVKEIDKYMPRRIPAKPRSEDESAPAKP